MRARERERRKRERESARERHALLQVDNGTDASSRGSPVALFLLYATLRAPPRASSSRTPFLPLALMLPIFSTFSFYHARIVTYHTRHSIRADRERTPTYLLHRRVYTHQLPPTSLYDPACDLILLFLLLSPPGRSCAFPFPVSCFPPVPSAAAAAPSLSLRLAPRFLPRRVREPSARIRCAVDRIIITRI